MPFIFNLVLIFITAVIAAAVGISKNLTVLKTVAGLLFTIGASIVVILIFGLNDM